MNTQDFEQENYLEDYEEMPLTPAHHIAFAYNGREVVAHGPAGGSLEALVAAQACLMPEGLQDGAWREVAEDYVPDWQKGE